MTAVERFLLPAWRWCRRGVLDFAGIGNDATYLWPRWLVLRAVGLVFIIIFAGIIDESAALVGPRGLLPVPQLIEQAREGHASALVAFLHRPSLFWLNSTPAMIQLVQWGGMASAAALVLNLWPRMALFGCWVSLLSFARLWLVFSEPQVDWLMLEVALICIPFAPAGLRPGLGADRPPSPLALFMVRWLLFRVMFGPGVAKLVSGEPRWLDFTALDYLYRTAPCPTVLGYYDHHLPHAWHVAEWVLTFVAELAAPLAAVVGGRRWRWLALASWIALQVGIQLTCNFGWLNTASIGLGLLLLDDQMLAQARGWLRGAWAARLFPAPPAVVPRPAGPRWRSLALAAFLWAHFALSLVIYANPDLIPKTVHAFGSVNAFKLYSRFDALHQVTEFVGTNDGGRTWRPYEFRYFPQRLDRMSPFVAPRFPRFEASLQILLATRDAPSPIYGIIAGHLLTQNPKVLRLFRANPFPDRPPQAIRMPTFHYTFTDLATHAATGRYWQREYTGEYLAMVHVDAKEQIVRAESSLDVVRALAGFGNPEAQTRLGTMHAAGEEGLKANPVQAAAWYRQAADQGFAEGQYLLAVMLAAGDGVARDLPQAAQWCRRAAEQGHPGAQYMFGIMAYRGDGVAKDAVESLAWFRLAERAGQAEAAKRTLQVQMQLDAGGRAAADRRTEELARSLEAGRK